MDVLVGAVVDGVRPIVDEVEGFSTLRLLLYSPEELERGLS